MSQRFFLRETCGVDRSCLELPKGLLDRMAASARGGIVDEAACATALRGGKLFAGLGNAMLTPRISPDTAEANHRASSQTVDAVARVLAKGR